jgi:ABC-type Na+ efflux pump permease subunit
MYTISGIAGEFAAWFSEKSAAPGYWTVHPVSDSVAEEQSGTAGMISAIMAMMLVFYCFFTGASAAQSILEENETGTLPRLFTTPTPRAVVLGGKTLSVLAMLAVQVAVLTLVSALAFGIHWGSLPAVCAAMAGTALLSAGFAIFLTSFLKSTKQAGLVFGVVVNLTGWVGIIRLFGGVIPGMAKINGVTEIVSLISPQGWAARLWMESMAGQTVGLTLAGTLLLTAALFAVGIRRLQKRFAA